MKILWLHQYFATPKGWGAVRTYEFARRFCSKGHAVDVVCCAGYDASLQRARGGIVEVEGVRVFVNGTTYRPHMGFWRRIGSFLWFMAYALSFVVRRGRRYDMLIASSGPLTLAIPALIGRWCHRLPFVFEVIDVWPDSAIAAGVLKNPILKKWSFTLEKMAYRYASAIVTCSTGMTERVERKIKAGMVESAIPVTTISNCSDLEQFVPNAKLRRETRKHFGISDAQTVVLYTGAMGTSNAIDDLLDAIRDTACDARLVWWLVGDGPRGDELRATLASVGCHRFFGSLPKEELVALYLAADVNMVTFMHGPLFYENSPNKFFDGIASGLPTVFNRSTWLEPWLKTYGCGIVCPASDKTGHSPMAEVLFDLASNVEKRWRMGEGARRLAEEVFNRDKLAKNYLEILEKVQLKE